MKKKEKIIKLTSNQDLKDALLGKIGTPKRDKYEEEVRQEFLSKINIVK